MANDLQGEADVKDINILGPDGTVADVTPSGHIPIEISTQDEGPVDVIDIDGKKYLRVASLIEGSAGSQVTLSKANHVESNVIASIGSGFNIILDLVVPVGKTWYLKSLIIATERSSVWKLTIGGTSFVQGVLDADDALEFALHGYEVPTGISIKFEMKCGAVNQDLYGNLIIYEETNI